MRKTGLALATMALALLLSSGAALALPAGTPDRTPMLNGPVRAFAQVGDLLWVGGNFTQVRDADGAVLDGVANVAVFDLRTGDYVDIAPKLGGSKGKVTELEVYGDTVVVGGSFSGPSAGKKNLVSLDGTTGKVVRWYNAAALEALLAAPSLGTIYAGGKQLQGFDIQSTKRLWTRSPVGADDANYPTFVRPGYRDLDLDPDGQTVWAACICDTVSGNPAKALVRLDAEGRHDAAWVSSAPPDSFGISLAEGAGGLYLAAGGSDYVARFSKADGSRDWTQDVSGSAQAIEVSDGQLLVGGHFWEVSDDGTPEDTDPETPDYCGFRSSNTAVTLDPDDQCQTRHGLAVYGLDGALDPSWGPPLEGRYALTWAIHPEATANGTRLHVGGDFTSAAGARQTYYARFS